MLKNMFNKNRIESEFYEKSDLKIKIIKNLFTRQNIVIYIVGLLLSMVRFNVDVVSPYTIAFIAAVLASGQAVGVLYLITLAGTYISFGGNSVLTYFMTTLVFFMMVLVIRPKIEEHLNERRRIGGHLFFSMLLVQIISVFMNTFLGYSLAVAIMTSITTYIFYKIFANGIIMLKEFGYKKVYTIEEVMGTSIILAIATLAFSNIYILGFSVSKILTILIVLVLGWKNGMLVGGTSGITIGTVLGVISGLNPMMIAVYALSGFIAGILNKFGRVGVVLGFLTGNVIIAYAANGNLEQYILVQEILIASIGLLAIPRSIKINIEDIFSDTVLLPETTPKNLESNKDTISKLNSISDTIFDMAKSYAEAAATVVTKADIQKQEKINIGIFIEELRLCLDGKQNNMLFDEIYYINNNVAYDIFKYLLDEDMINEKVLVKILENNNIYIMGFENTKVKAKEDVYKIVRAINQAYKISKINFIWQKRMEQSKQTVSTQLKNVSEVITKMAENMEESNEEFMDKIIEIKKMLLQKNIDAIEVKLKQVNSNRNIVEVYTKTCDELDGTKCNVKKIGKLVGKALNQNMVIQNETCGLRLEEDFCKYTYMSEDAFSMQFGISKTTKSNSIMSGDSSINMKLEDGKVLMAISDGMGSGPEAMKSSKIAIKMLERLLKAGFNKEESLKLINSTLVANSKDDMHATLDMQILDLYNGNMEFIKHGACPTYIKRKNEVFMLKSNSLPTGIMDNIDLVIYDYDLQDGDIIVMCSDGILDSNDEYVNKDLWLKYLLEEINNDDAQGLADLITKEAIDNEYGKVKDDMTVLVSKINKKRSKV